LIQQAFHCYFGTKWIPDGNEFYDANVTLKDVSFCFGEILPDGVRQLLAIKEMKTAKARHFLDLGCGNGRMILQAFLENPHMNVSGIELHPGRFWKGYHALQHLCELNPGVFKIINFDSKTVGKRYITVESIVYGNLLSIGEGNFLDDLYLPLISKSDIVFVEVELGSVTARQQLFIRLLQMKADATFLLYEPMQTVLESLSSKHFTSTLIKVSNQGAASSQKQKEAGAAASQKQKEAGAAASQKQKEANDDKNEYETTIVTSLKSKTSFNPFYRSPSVPAIRTTWAPNRGYPFAILCRSKFDCSALLKEVHLMLP
jgi:hypothetical protein